jgi:hypothetical protein
VAGCAKNELNCSGSCIDPRKDAANCGECGQRCAAADGSAGRCKDGVCEVACASNLTRCDGVCVNSRTDPDNCGGCGKTCDGLLAICLAGDCLEL